MTLVSDGATCAILLPNSTYIYQRKLKLLLSLKESSQRGLRVFPDGSVGREPVCNAWDPRLIPELGRSPGEWIGYPLQCSWASLVAQLVRNPLASWETWVRSLGWGDSLEKGKVTHSSILAWRSPWTEELGGLQSMESQRVGHNWVTFTFTFRGLDVILFQSNLMVLFYINIQFTSF